MAVTMKKISEISGVSRGTVDRVLNGRGNVRPETEELVRQVAESLGYKPNLAGKALAARKKSYVISVLLTSEGVPFFDEVIRGVESAERQLSDYGVKVRLKKLKGYSVENQLNALNELAESSNAIIFNPINDERVLQKMDEFKLKGLPVVAVNTDIDDSPKLCYVGADYMHNGKTAAGVMRLLLGTGNKKIVIFAGHEHISGHNQRVDGFKEIIESRCGNCAIVDVRYTQDDDFIAYDRAVSCFAQNPEIDGIYISASGAYGVCRAVKNAFTANRPLIVCSDLTPAIADMMKEGIIHASVCQKPYSQGYWSVKRAFDYLISPEPAENYIVADEIKILENIDN